jgi:membrane-associated phospholipid phosphatase
LKGRLYAFDIIAVAFLLVLAAAIALFGGFNPYRWWYVAADIAAAITVAALAFVFGDTRVRGLRFVRHWYLAPVWFLCYHQTSGPFVHLLWSRSFDSAVLNLESSVFGLLPSIWVQRLFSPALTEIMMLGYYTYFLQLITVAAVLYFFIRRMKPFHETVAAASLAYFASYATFVLIPVASPRFSLPPMHYEGLLLTGPMRAFIEHAGNVGGAFPSSHVAVAVVCVVFGLRYHRPTGRLMLATSILLTLGTIYGSYHYVADVAAGLLYGALACAAAPPLVRWFESRYGTVSSW